METIKIGSIEVKRPFHNVQILNDGKYILITPSEAHTLGSALVEKFGVWLPAKDAPLNETVWLKDSHGNIYAGKSVGDGSFATLSLSAPSLPTHFQPIIKPKA